MSNTLNDLILTDVAGLAVGDSLAPGAGLTGVTDSSVVTSWGDPTRLAVGDTYYSDAGIATITDLSTITADVTYVDALGNTVTASMTLLVIEVTDSGSGVPSQMLLPVDAAGDLVHITAIDVTAVDTTPGMTDYAFADLSADDTVTLAAPGTVDGTAAGELISDGWVDGDGDAVDNSGNRIEANAGDDTVYGGTGNDTILGGAGRDWLFGGDGDDSISGNDGDDSIWGDAGNDTLYGNEGNDKLIGGAGSDLLIGGEGDNLMYGDDAFGDTGGWLPGDSPEPGYGSDTLVMGNGDDTAYGGSGDDVFRVFDEFGNHQITGGEAGETIGDEINATLMTADTTVTYTGDEAGTMASGGNTATFTEIERIQLGSGDDHAEVLTSTSGYIHGGSGYDQLVLPDPLPGDPAPVVTITGNIDNGDGTHSYSGYVDFPDGSRLEFESFEEILCFTPGTLIDTTRGRVAVEALVAGDRVLTRDHGYQALVWTGRRDLTAADLAACPAAAPVRIAAGALGAGLPERDLVVSPRHRMLVTGARAELMFGEREVLVAAADLLGLPGVSRAGAGSVSYVHVMCERHEIIRAEGSWTESFQPAEAVMNALDAATRDELLGLFPALATEAGRDDFAAARPVLSGAEARTLFAA
ncbi:MAG: Hint domain-containing protein [Rhodobacteraceae bacterium]|nr:Hint domain-containing protein [Paracoccaceae bacterium]